MPKGQTIQVGTYLRPGCSIFRHFKLVLCVVCSIFARSLTYLGRDFPQLLGSSGVAEHGLSGVSGECEKRSRSEPFGPYPKAMTAVALICSYLAHDFVPCSCCLETSSLTQIGVEPFHSKTP